MPMATTDSVIQFFYVILSTLSGLEITSLQAMHNL